MSGELSKRLREFIPVEGGGYLAGFWNPDTDGGASVISAVVRLENERDMWRDRVKDVEDTLRTARLDELNRFREGLIELHTQRNPTADAILEWVDDRIADLEKENEPHH